MKRFLSPPGSSRRQEAHLALLSIALALATPSLAAEFKLGSHTFTLPDGFTIEVAAQSSLVPRPIEADFDEQGRLYVTDSSGTNDKVAKQLADKPHRVLRLEDTDNDGVFDKSVVFADKMMFPEGALWHDGSLFVSAPPSIWKLTDTNSDGAADVRVEWFKGQSLGGCANDLHGPYLGPDGWIYWCKGGFERQTNILGNGKTFSSRASHIWRARPDGSGLEPIMTGGMDNPVGLAWSAEGELFLSGTFFQHPGGGKRDGLIHVIYGGVYGKENDALEGHPRTGDLMPIMTHLGPAAPVGLARYESSVFGAEYQDNLFLCQFNLHKISRHILQPSGSTFTTLDRDFLVSDNPDFHPTDVFEDADGSLLVIDTGGWYKLCCPTSQLPKPDVLGAIYRIRRRDAPKVNDPRGLKLAWSNAKSAELIPYLKDARPAVVRRAVIELGRRGTNSLPALLEFLRGGTLPAQAALPASFRNAIWALTRMEKEEALLALEMEPGQAYNSVTAAALNSAALRRSVRAASAVFGIATRGTDPRLRRAAFTALGRLRALVIPEFLTLQDDRSIEHALIYALIERGDAEDFSNSVQRTSARIRRAALIALDQMPGGNLKPEQVTPLLASTNALLKPTANWILSHHPEWAGALAGFLKERLAAPNLSEDERAELQQQLAQFARHASVQQLLADAARDAATPIRLTALRAMARSGVKETPPAWASALATAVTNADREVIRQAVVTTRALPAPKQNGENLSLALSRLAADTNQPAAPRVEALAAIPQSGWTAEGGSFDLLVSSLQPDQPTDLRAAAASAIGKAKLSETQLTSLVEALRGVGPMELPKLLVLFARASDETLGVHLIEALQDARSFRSLRTEQVRSSLTNFPATVRAKADALLATLNTDAVKEKARLDELSLNLKSGDVRRGQVLFNSQKAACSACHAIGYLGGNLGPDLTKIGQVRTERDLLEAVIFPSASFVRSYEPMLVVTKSGDEHSGVLRRDAPDEVVLGTGVNAEVRLARTDIAEMRPSTVSVMPAGLDEQLSRQELADLLAFLKATRW